MTRGVVIAHAGQLGSSIAERAGGVHRDDVLADQGAPGSRAAELLKDHPDVLLLGPELADGELVALTEFLDLHHPEVAVVWVRTPTPEAWQMALRSGARDVIDPEADTRTITEALDRARLRLLSRQQFGNSPAQAPARGAVIVVASPKGGCGKTMVSTNLALAMASELPGEVLLIDLDVQFGDVASHLRLAPTYGVHSAAAAGLGTPDITGNRIREVALGVEGELKAFLTPYESSLMTLCSPDDPAAAEDVTPTSVTQLLTVARSAFRIVIVDTGAGLDDVTLAAIDAADELVLVSSTEVPAVRAVRTELALLDRLGTSAHRHLVLNRSDAKVGLSMSDIELALEMKFSARIPSTIDIPESINLGTPIVSHRPRSAATRELQALARQLLRSAGVGDANGLPPSDGTSSPGKRLRARIGGRS
jgi:pilus assembly protein CpaE